MLPVTSVTNAILLELWELGSGCSPGERALHFLNKAIPDVPIERLADWSVGRRDLALLEFRTLLFGDPITALASCPACREVLELDFSAEEIRGEPQSWEAGPWLLEEGQFRLKVRLPNAGDLAELAREFWPQAGRVHGPRSPDPAR